MMYSGKRIDAHTHCIFDCDWDRIFAFMDELNIAKMNCICGSPRYSEMRVAVFRDMYRRHPDRFSWGTYLPVPDFTVSESAYVDRAIEHIDRHFEEGATSCKIHNTIGMRTRRPDGTYIMVDDPLFDPIFDHIAARDRVLILHIAEPWPRWPSWPEDDPALAGKRIYRPLADDPQWGDLDCPGYHRQIEAEENAIKKHPDLKVLGAHLAAVGQDVAWVAGMLDRCPNLAVDTSARRRDLAVQEGEKVRDFVMRYQDRILWGMDQQNYTVMSELSETERDGFYTMMRHGYEFEFGLYESGDIVQVDEFQVRGLDLPADVLEKVYRKNAERWFGL